MIAILSFVFIILFSIFSESCIPAVAFTVKQFLTVVLPSILPFYVIADILKKSGFIEKTGNRCNKLMYPIFGLSGSSIFAIIIGMISGYPAGATITAEMYLDNKISNHDAKVLSSFTNNTGPLFLIGAVGAGMLNSVKKGIFLYTIHILSSVIIGLIISNTQRKKSNRKKAYEYQQEPHVSKSQFLKILSESMTKSVYTMLPIAGAIIFFSAIIAVLKSTDIFPFLIALGRYISLDEPLKGLLPGFFEITTGIYDMSQTTLPDIIKLPLISLITGFAGLSVHTQVIGILSKAGINCRLYLTGKFLQSILSALLTFVLMQFIAF